MDKRTYRVLFSVTKKDLVFEYFRASGPGGQKVNKTSSACRVRHPPSGAVGESREERKQPINRRIAFRRMAESKEFQQWAKVHAAVIEQGYRDIEQKVDHMLQSDNIRVEYSTTYTCDVCGRSETIVSDTPGKLPEWVELVDKKCDEHHCAKCS